MRRLAPWLLTIVVLVWALVGCGGGGSQTDQSAQAPAPASPTPAPPAVETPAAAATSKYDSGPRAGESPMNAALAAQGEKLFTAKGCAVCHGFGKKITCPDLIGVSMRRTQRWMEEQILHPEVMVKEDPIARELRKGFPLEMTNMKLAPAEAKAVIEFLKKKDKEAGVQGMAS